MDEKTTEKQLSNRLNSRGVLVGGRLCRIRFLFLHVFNRMRNLVTEKARQKQKSNLYFSTRGARVGGHNISIPWNFL